MTNLSLKQLAAIAALCISMLVAIIVLFMSEGWQAAAIAFIITFIFAYYFISFVFDKFIDRRIKLIYKFINQTKASKRQETYYKYILPKKTIGEVQQDVERWAAQHTEEIDKLKNNEEFRKDFLLNLSHEFKTPIFAIQGYVDTLLAGALSNPAVNKQFLERTASNVDRMVNLLEDLDEITSLESGQQPLQKTSFVIQNIIKEVYESLQIHIAAKNIKPLFKRGAELPVYVFGDREKIRQVLTNLVENAVKYGKENGTITASIDKTDKNQALIEISDDGVGIAEEHLSRIFERFYRTDSARSRNVGGSGLGLAICKHIIEAHNQTIHVRSQVNIGTTIGFTLATK